MTVVTVADEIALLDVLADADAAGCPYAAFREPDLDDAHTAVALLPGSVLNLSLLPLLGEGVRQ